MTKIKRYPLKNPIAKDFFVGTDSEDNSKTVNFSFEDTTRIINKLNGISVISYRFVTSENIELAILTEGHFLSIDNKVSILGITKLYINKNTFDGDDLLEMYRFLKLNSDDFYIKLQNSNNAYNSVYFNIKSIEDRSTHFILNIDLLKSNPYLSSLVNYEVYFFFFQLKSPNLGSQDGSGKANDNEVIHTTGDEKKTGNLLLEGNLTSTEAIGADLLILNSNEHPDSRVFKLQQETNGIVKLQKSSSPESSNWIDLLTIDTDGTVVVPETMRAAPALVPSDLAQYSQVLKENLLTVAKSGGQYSTIDSALSYAKLNSTKENPITILVYPGKYKEFLQITPDKYITITGINRETVILYDDSGDYFNAPILMAGNVTIENMTIWANHNNESVPKPSLPSYAIHHDAEGEGVSIIRNCNLISEQNAAIGIGLQNNQQLHIDNCKLIGVGPNAIGLLMHPFQNSGATNQRMYVSNCFIQGDSDKVIALIDSNNNGSGTGDNIDTYLFFKNNYLFSTTTGTVNLVYGTSPIDGGQYGKMKLNNSFGNNIGELNDIKYLDLDQENILNGKSILNADIELNHNNRIVFGANQDGGGSVFYGPDGNLKFTPRTGYGFDFLGEMTAKAAKKAGQVVILSQLQAAVKPTHLIYTALAYQSGTDKPIVTVIDNTLGGTVDWAYFDVGRFIGTLPGVFTVNNTTVEVSRPNPGATAFNTLVSGNPVNGSDAISYSTYNSTGYVNGQSFGVLIKVKVKIIN